MDSIPEENCFMEDKEVRVPILCGVIHGPRRADWDVLELINFVTVGGDINRLARRLQKTHVATGDSGISMAIWLASRFFSVVPGYVHDVAHYTIRCHDRARSTWQRDAKKSVAALP